jgi:hypothetical protein
MAIRTLAAVRPEASKDERQGVGPSWDTADDVENGPTLTS